MMPPGAVPLQGEAHESVLVEDERRDATYLATLGRRKRRSVVSIVSGVGVLAIVGAICYSVAQAPFDWTMIGHYFTQQQIVSGVEHTMLLTVLAMAVGMVIGIIGGICRLSHNRVVSSTAWLYVWFFRATPVLVQLLLWFNLALIWPHLSIPGLVHEPMNQLITPLVAAVLGLGLNEGAYLSEIIRGGILAVDQGQKEAAMAIGSSPAHMYRRIVLPQTMQIILPSLGNETISMLKYTSLASAVSYTELLENSQQIYEVTTRVMELLIVASLWYIILTSVLTVGQYYLERHYGRSGRGGRQRALFEQMVINGLSRVIPRIQARRASATGGAS